MILSPNSEDIIESERKDYDNNQNPNIHYNIRKLGNFNDKFYNNIIDETLNSHNVSNIEEFLNDIEFNNMHERF